MFAPAPARSKGSPSLTALPRARHAPWPAIGAAEFPVFHELRREAHAGLLPRAILDGEPYPVRGMIVSGSSILTAWPEPSRWRRANSSAPSGSSAN